MARRAVQMNLDTPHTTDPAEAEELLLVHGKVMLLDEPMRPGGVAGTWITTDLGGRRRKKRFDGVSFHREAGA